jgi:hypothetical protein
MNIEITRKDEVVVTPKVEVAPVILSTAQLDGLVELMIQAGGMSATERIGSHNLQSLTITADSQQGADEDGTHTIYTPVYRVDIKLK